MFWGQTVYFSTSPFVPKSCTIAWGAKVYQRKLYMRRNLIENRQIGEKWTDGQVAPASGDRLLGFWMKRARDSVLLK